MIKIIQISYLQSRGEQTGQPLFKANIILNLHADA
jgi:hypothetical protein